MTEVTYIRKYVVKEPVGMGWRKTHDTLAEALQDLEERFIKNPHPYTSFAISIVDTEKKDD